MNSDDISDLMSAIPDDIRHHLNMGGNNSPSPHPEIIELGDPDSERTNSDSNFGEEGITQPNAEENLDPLWAQFDHVLNPAESRRKEIEEAQNSPYHPDLNDPESSGSESSDPEPVPKRRRKKNARVEKSHLGGFPENMEYVEADDPLEPEQEYSDEEQWTLYLVEDEDIDPPPFPLVIWESTFMSQQEDILEIVGLEEANMYRLRRELTDKAKEAERQARLEDPQPRALNEEAYQYNMWFRREHGFENHPRVEIYEKTHLLKSPEHPTGFRVCEGFFKAGLTIPLPKLVVSLLNYLKKAPCQLTSIAYAQIALAIEIGKHFETEITLEEFLSMFYVQLAAKGDEMRNQMITGRPVYCFCRKPKRGYFTPPSKLAYVNSQVYEIYGNAEPMGDDGEVYQLQYKVPNDYDIKKLPKVGNRDPQVLNLVGTISLTERRRLFPKFKNWFPNKVQEQEDAKAAGKPYKDPKIARKEAAEDKRRIASGLAPRKRRAMGKIASSTLKSKKSKRAPTPTEEVPTTKLARITTADQSDKGKNIMQNPVEPIPAPAAGNKLMSDAMRSGATNTRASTQPDVVATSSAIQARPPFQHPYSKVENKVTLKNRLYRAQLSDHPEQTYQADFIDGEGFPLHRNSSLIFDPMAAGMYANLATATDLFFYEDMLKKGGATLVLQDSFSDIARANTRTIALLQYCIQCEQTIQKLRDHLNRNADPMVIQALEKKIAELEKAKSLLKTKYESLKEDNNQKSSYIKELEK